MDESPTTERGGQPPTPKPPPVLLEVKSGVALPPKVSELGGKPGRKAKQEPRFRFYALYDRICRLGVLTAAWWLVLEHKGVAGVDGRTCQDIIDGPGAALFLLELILLANSGGTRAALLSNLVLLTHKPTGYPLGINADHGGMPCRSSHS